MKKYTDLTSAQKDKAADAALKVLVRQIVDGLVKPKLSKENQEFVTWWMIHMDKETAYLKILDNDDVAHELWSLAEDMAATAYYPAAGEYVINDIA